MDKLRTPLLLNAVYLILLGLATLTPSLTGTVFGYDVKDPGVLLVLSGTFLGFGVVLWAIAGNPETHGKLAMAVAAALVIAIIFVVWGWARGSFTARNALVPLIINVGLVVWIWSARPKS